MNLPLSFVAAIYALVAPYGCSPEVTTHHPRPVETTQPQREKPLKLRQIEVTLLGKTSDLKGIKWAPDPEGNDFPTGLEEPCDLTIRLPGGKVLKLRTRPILIVSRIMLTDIIGTIDAPPEGSRGSLREKAAEVERLLAQWKIVPSSRLRADLEEWKQENYSGTGIGGRLRVGMDLDKQTSISFRVDSGGPRLGGCNSLWRSRLKRCISCGVTLAIARRKRQRNPDHRPASRDFIT
jgi:hypothetical protein